MCGICGVHRFGNAPIQKDMVDLLILNNQNRGLEAAGVALQQADGEVVIYKNNLTPHEFITSDDYNAFMEEFLKPDTVTVLGHTRKATKGPPRIITNNHPMYAGLTAVVHNGQIFNDDTLFKDMHLERKTETDSDIIRAILDKEGLTREGVNKLNKMHGNAAIAAISPKYPGKLLLARSGNPLEIMATQDHFIFSSERGPLYKAIRPFKLVYGIVMREMTPSNYYMISMTDDSAWLFSEKPRDGERSWANDWLEWHQEFKIAQNYSPVHYECNVQFHGARVKFYDDRPIDVVVCPQCSHYLAVNSAILSDLKKYKCKSCGSKLG